MVLKKSSLMRNFSSLILAENPLFFPDFPDWKKSSKFSLIGGNPVISAQTFEQLTSVCVPSPGSEQGNE